MKLNKQLRVSLRTKGWFDGWHLPPGIIKRRQVYILKNIVILGKYLTVLKNFGKKTQKKKKKKKNTPFLGQIGFFFLYFCCFLHHIL